MDNHRLAAPQYRWTITALTIVGDGSRWWIPRHSEIVRGPPTGEEHGAVIGRARQRPKGAEHSDHLINVNTASQKELETLPGVGPVIARRIIEGRPYQTVDDLLTVKGIGAKRLEEIRPLVGGR